MQNLRVLVYEARRVVHFVVYHDEEILLAVVLGDFRVGILFV